ncbi:FAS1 domain [Macleaya cordata]|uniref:FAS1 domain n=1 Tax=Macleaya cordata TaxID=56857 RepID=A0A200QPY5_MACCD|nr:FAS1 domain [Macleaya cordata]
MAPFFLTSLILLSLFPISAPVLPSQLVSAAIDILSDSGFVSMSLTLQIVSQNLKFPSPSATIFAPSDAVFLNSGQPGLSVLQYHFSPLKYSLETLKSLPFGTKIPTLSPNQSLIVTTSDGQISLNNVKVNESAIIDVGSLSIFAIEDFFDPSFQVNRGCKNPFSDDSSNSDFDSVIANASAALLSRGFSVMSSFLDLQLPGLKRDTTMNMTIFAPVDEVLEQYSRNFTFSSVFRRHFLPCKLTGTDLFNLDEGATLETFSQGFTIKVTRSGDVLVLNDVPVTAIAPDIYSSDSVVVHGLQQIITIPQSFSLGDDHSDYGD